MGQDPIEVVIDHLNRLPVGSRGPTISGYFCERLFQTRRDALQCRRQHRFLVVPRLRLRAWSRPLSVADRAGVDLCHLRGGDFGCLGEQSELDCLFVDRKRFPSLGGLDPPS